MKVNRILIVVAVVLIVITFYEVRLKPQSRPLYERALVFYRQENHNASLLELQRAYEIEPNSSAILVLMGWNNLKLRQYDQARENFGRAARLDPKLIEAQLGLAYVNLETGQGEAPVAGIQALLEQDPGNRDFQLAAAVAFRQAGQNLPAVEIFHKLESSSRYGDVARKNLLEMYGLEGLDEPIPSGLPPLARPSQLQPDFRVNGNYLQHRAGGSWKPFYVKGVNLGPAIPGAFPSEPPVRADKYQEWLSHIAQMGANTVRAYSLLPPAFYRALKIHNEKTQLPRLYLLQQVWLVGSETQSLFPPEVIQASQTEIRYALDAIHGQGDVPMRRGLASGLYTADVSAFTLGLLLGRVIEPHQVIANNDLNSFRKSYDGKFVRVENGNATEVWLGSMAEYAAGYETEKYNQQRPVGIVNWPGLDPLPHPTEASLQEEISVRRNRGERAAMPPANEIIDDNDVVSVDETRLRVRTEFQGGIFSFYSVFPFYPDFLYREPAYLSVRDAQGPNPFFGYLKALKGHYKNMPVVVGEYGISTSLGVARFHPLGWNHGGLTEREQGELLARMTRNIAEAGLAGGLISGLQDEWYKANWLLGSLALPMERRPLWNNKLDPDQGFGLWTYDPPSDARLFSGFSGWNSVAPLYQKAQGLTSPLSDGWDSQRTLRSLSVSSDAAFVYLRMQVNAVRSRPNNTPDLKNAHYFIGISTAPRRFGSQTLPGLAPQVRTDSGLNFLLYLSDEGARLFIASNYNPRETKPIAGVSSVVQVGYRIPFEPKLEKWSGFEEIVVEVNRRRFARDGRMFPAQRHNYSLLRYRPAGQTDDTLATWTCDFGNQAFIFRLPWAQLLVMDPSSHRVLAGVGGGPQFVATQTSGLQLFALSFRPSDPIQFHLPFGRVPVADSLPARDGKGSFQGLKTYIWAGWNSVTVQGRPKTGYPMVQKLFRELRGPSS